MEAEDVRIVIADDHPIFRAGLRSVLEAEPGFVVVGEAGNGDEAVRLTLSLRPDVLLLDLVHVLRGLTAASPEKTPPERFGVTPRELEITAAVVAGFSNKEIAKKFSLSQDTVKHHLTNIFDKVGASNRLELVLFAVHHRLLEDEPATPTATG